MAPSEFSSKLTDQTFVYYVLLRALDAFYETHKRYPGLHSEELDSDFILYRKSVNSYLTQIGCASLSTSILDEHLQEMYALN
jgi:hypothetical protein